MDLSKKTTVALLLFVLSLNYAIRYPRTPHELGFDAFVLHGMTVSFLQEGHAKWIIHPLSYLGLYPLSHPSGSLFVLGAIALTSNSSIEAAILAFDMMLVAAGLLIAFILSIQIRRDEGLAVLVAAIFTLSPRLVTSLLWEVPTRTLFTILVPLFVWLLLRWHHTKDNRWLGLVPVVFLLMMSAHRLTVLVAVFAIAFVLTQMLIVLARTLRVRYASRVLGGSFRRTANVLVLVAFVATSAGLLAVGGVLQGYETGQVDLGSGTVAQLSNLAVSVARSAGFLIPLVPVGVVAVYRSRSRGLKEVFLLMTLLVLIPTLSLRQYTGYYIIPFTAVFIGLGLRFLIQRCRRTVTRTALAAGATVVMLVSSYTVLSYDLSFEPFIDNTSYNHGLYILHRSDGTIVSNDGRTGSMIYAISGAPYLPVGGATTAFQSPELLIFGFLDGTQLRIGQVPLTDLTVESDSPFVLIGVQAEFDWAQMMDRSINAVPSRIWQTYHPTYLLEVWKANGGYLAYGNRYDSPFIASVHLERYKTFEVPGQTLWYIGGSR